MPSLSMNQLGSRVSFQVPFQANPRLHMAILYIFKLCLGSCPSSYFGVFFSCLFFSSAVNCALRQTNHNNNSLVVSHVHPAPFADKSSVHVTSPVWIMRFFCQCIHQQTPLWLLQLQAVWAGTRSLCHKISGVWVLLPGK